MCAQLSPSGYPPPLLTTTATAATGGGHQSAFSAVVQPLLPQPKALPAMSPLAQFYPQLMCLPGLLDRLGPHILRSHATTGHCKPIPANERVDLERFREREPRDWTMDDVVAWILDVARRHRIPFEDVAMTKFASSTGPLLLLMNERQFLERDPNFGSLLFREFRRLVVGEHLLLVIHLPR
jgi:hypothetical protein